jgi:hypothetical protein
VRLLFMGKGEEVNSEPRTLTVASLDSAASLESVVASLGEDKMAPMSLTEFGESGKDQRTAEGTRNL